MCGFWRDTIQCTKRAKLESWDICGEKVLPHLSRVVGMGSGNEATREWRGSASVAMALVEG